MSAWPPESAIPGSVYQASFYNTETRDRFTAVHAGELALAGQVAGDLMTALNGTQWARLTRTELLSDHEARLAALEAGVMEAYQFSATFTGGGGAEDIDVDITAVGLADINSGVVILQTAPLGEAANISAYLTSATNVRVSSDASVNASTFRFTVLKLGDGVAT